MTKFLFIDTETTGKDVQKAGLHQLSGFIVIDNQIKESFDIKVKPFSGCQIENEALETCNISYNELYGNKARLEDKDAYICFNHLLCKYIDKFDKSDKFIVVGYNVRFDIEILSNLYLRNEDEYFFALVYGNYIDVMSLATQVLLNERNLMEDFKQGTVAKYIGLEISEDNLHNSMYDIKVCYQIYSKITNVKFNWSSDIIINTNENFFERYKNPITLPYEQQIMIVLSFGKYKGQTIWSVMNENPYYIKWLYNQGSDLITKEIFDKTCLIEKAGSI